MAPAFTEGAQVLITLVSTIGGIVVAGFGFLGVRANQTRAHARSAAADSAISRGQLENSHTTNLREENDERHERVMSTLDGQTKALAGIKRDIGRLADADLEHSRVAREDRARLTAHLDSLTNKENK